MAGKKYIITFSQSAKTPEIESLYSELESQGSHISKKAHESVIMKYSVATLEPSMLHSLKSNNIIESIEEDKMVSISPIPGTHSELS
ncbi:hypothetical protein BDY24DRAFT_382498 [Mrakia frigida]|uniref:uncharacterized protein n=1 Tax=Mrakia frigida TaxID=29902 RepID=UPI003FCBF888